MLAILGSSCWQAAAQTPETQSVVVTGSRIVRAALEGPSPVTVITGEEITRQGYKNVFDALNNQVQNSGFVQGEDFGNTFTPSANTISLRGLGPNHTLILLNGRRMADFPVAYGGSVNFTNLSNIPSSMVERIEILSGGASAVYGSDAISGVVNVILKKQAQGYDANVKLSDTSRGGGGSRRAQFSGGVNGDKLNAIFSVELSERDMLWTQQRDFMAERSGTPTAVLTRKVVKGGALLDLGDACDKLGDLFGGSVIKYTAKKGSYCASPKAGATYWTTQTQNKSQNFSTSVNYELTPETSLYGDFLIGKNSTENSTRGPSWTSSSTNGSYFLNEKTKAYEAWTKYIAPEEIGGAGRYNRSWDDLASSLAFGIKGTIPHTGWTYEAGYSASVYQSKNYAPRALANIDSFFLGPQKGVDSAGIAIYAPDLSRLTRRLSAAEFDSITGSSVSKDKSWTHGISIITSGDAFTLPAGVAKVATVAELGRQGFSNSPDPRINEGYFNTTSKSDVTAGTRNRYALGAEINLPLLKEVTGTLAGRYDRYSFAGRSDGKFTYASGLEIRPIKQVLLRGSYATSFRAPDMNYIYKSRGTGYYSSTTDHYRCAQAGKALEDCDYAGMSPGANYVQYGSKDLKSEKGKSYGVGVVWSPSTSFDVSLDYWNIKIDNLVTNLSSDKLLRDESDCRLGKADINSPSCVDTLRRVERYPLTALNKPGEIREITTNPINAAHESSSGFDLSLKYQWKTTDYGSFVWKADYSRTLTKRSKQFEGDAISDDLNTLSNVDWPSKFNTSLSWNIGDWTNTLFVTRYSKTPNSGRTAELPPTGIANLSTVYRVNKNATVSLIVNNVFNKVKYDSSGGWPYYPIGRYSPLGRLGSLEFNYHFGS
ncbi:TonB-dependent receptor plug domain-containing protein [Janthinobacterium fluminis]|uniref:TonB-dependent receptor n=1 Tax=Janthinobacterium fluminis TaxID=2987524 RepID=A0ABT5K694_9BURK|nr:TonB-dependent receptor [Janthinobacterium fluminis]MDC8760424.1 TonB-dependent receptor [Janthinobacterium fluminis]